MKTKVIRPSKPFDYVEREHKDSASKYMQSLPVSVKMTQADGVVTFTPNHSFTEALAAARKCCDVRLLVSGSIEHGLTILYLAGFESYADSGVRKYRLLFASPVAEIQLDWTEDGLSILEEGGTGSSGAEGGTGISEEDILADKDTGHGQQ